MNARQRRVARRARERRLEDEFSEFCEWRASRRRAKLDDERRQVGTPHPDVPDEVARHVFARFGGKRPRIFSVDAIATLRAT